MSFIGNKGDFYKLVIRPFYLMAQGSVELRNVNADTLNHDDQELDALGANSEPQASSNEFSLPPVDTGAAAWLFLAACWGVEALTFGEILHNYQNIFSRLTRGNRLWILLWCFPRLL